MSNGRRGKEDRKAEIGTNLPAAEDAIQQGSVLVAEERQGNRAGLKDTNGRDKEAAARRALELMVGNSLLFAASTTIN